MAFNVFIEKFAGGEGLVTYRFWDFPDKVGVLSIGRKSGEIMLVEAMPGDSGNAHFTRAGVKILQYWRKGELPESARFCS